MVSLIYASKTKENLTMDDVNSILNASIENNKIKHVTGFLVWNGKFFLQCLEGDKESVDELFKMISLDKRHQLVTLLGTENIEKRNFSEWSMGFINREFVTKEILKKYTLMSEFLPLKYTYKEALSIMMELSKKI